MLSQLARVGLLAGVLGGFCLPAAANTTVAERAAGASTPLILAQSDLTIPRDYRVVAEPAPVRIALLLPLSSDTLGTAAAAVRAGFQAAYDRELDGIDIDVVDSGDTPQDVLARYREASEQHDIVVGPLSRTDVSALAQSDAVVKPTLALTPPDTSADGVVALPPRMLVMGLSIEDEARQVADWIGRDNPGKKAVVFFTNTAWQRRAARAFETRWAQPGRELQSIELAANDGFLNGRALLQLKKDLQVEAPVVAFAALDARQARQVRAIMGKDVVLYGTSQLNPFALADREGAARAVDMDGTHLLDIPWQLQPDHPAVMIYPKLVASADRKPSADMERLYALGIDAYRVAREIALQHDSFELDGVTGKLSVQLGAGGTHFERIAQHAVYRDGSVVSTLDAR